MTLPKRLVSRIRCELLSKHQIAKPYYRKTGIVLVTLVLVIVFQNCNSGFSPVRILGSQWRGPSTNVVVQNGRSLLSINGQIVTPSFLCLNTQGQRIANNDWSVFDYELRQASRLGTPIISVNLGAVTPAFLDIVYKHLEDNFPQAYVVLRMDLYDELPPTSDRMKFMNLSGDVVTHEYFSTLSQGWVNQERANLRNILKYVDGAYPGRTMGVQLAYLNTQEWFNGPKWTTPDNQGQLLPNPPYFQDYNADVETGFCAWLQQPTGSVSCTLPTPMERSQTSYGNVFLSDSSAVAEKAIKFNQYLSERTVDAIIALGQEVKADSNNNMMVSAAYGYLYELPTDGGIVGSGHLALQKLLESSAVDAIVSPFSYTHGRSLGTPVMFHGPMDSMTLHGKVSLQEDDTTTFLCALSNTCYYVWNPSTLSETQQILRRNILTAELHGAGTYFLDLGAEGWYGLPSAPADSNALWDSIIHITNDASIIDTASARYAPEVAIFTDDASLARLPLWPGPLTNGVPAAAFQKFLNALTSDTAYNVVQIGTPVKHYLASDLLNGNFPADKIKVAIFLNTFKLSSVVRAAIRNKLQGQNRTLVFLYAAGLAIDTDALTPNNLADITGLPIVRGAGASALTSQISFGGVTENDGDFGFDVDPWFYVNTVNRPDIQSFGAYANSGFTSFAQKDFGAYKVIYSATPDLSPALFRTIASQAGANIFDNSIGDAVEAFGNTLMVHANTSGTKTISLPFTAASVIQYLGSTEQTVCTNCATFQVPIFAKDTALFRLVAP